MLAACAGWKPDPKGPAYKDSYQVTNDGHYRVRRGDTLHAIAFNFGLDWKEIAAWNGIRSPYTIYPSTTREYTPETKSRSTTREYTPAPEPRAAPAASDPKVWLWPVEGKVISNFRPDDPARKGMDIGGKEGQAIIATAGGEVVYSGSGLIGYGELIIIKHNESLLSAYAHNRKRLVSEGQKVKAGERIAEMGRNDRNQAMLHFEIRLNGNPQDPRRYLP
jgi:lipoprotein NlpD